MQRPTKRNQASLYGLILNTPNLVESESRWLRCGHDLAAVAFDGDQGWFNGFVADGLNRISRGATKVSDNQPPKDTASAFEALQSSISRTPLTAVD